MLRLRRLYGPYDYPNNSPDDDKEKNRDYNGTLFGPPERRFFGFCWKSSRSVDVEEFKVEIGLSQFSCFQLARVSDAL